MNAFRTLALAVAVAGATAEAGAQGSCQINQGGSPELNGARQYFNNAAKSGGAASEKPKHLQNAVRVLNTPKAASHSNQLGRHWLMTKTLYQWTRQDGQALETTRGQLGYTENPDGPVDILAAIDTAMRAVEEINPACRDSTRVFRQNLFGQSYAKGVEALNSEEYETAIQHFRRALVVDRENANGWNGLAIVAQRQDDQDAMIENFARVIEYGGRDTVYAKVVESAMSNLAVLKVMQAEKLEGEAKSRVLREAETIFRNHLAKKPGDSNAQQGLARVLTALGDTAAIRAIYAQMLQNPANYTEVQFFEAGSGALRAEQKQLAVQLMEAGLQRNPYFRDGLYNLAAVYFDEDQADKLGVVAKRLVELDPQNPDNWRLYAGQFQIRNAAAQKAKKTPPAGTQDSLLHYIKKFSDMKVQVAINQFSHAGAKHTLSGSVINSADKPFEGTIEVEFLDKDGQVVGRKSAPVTAPASGSGDFTVEVTQSGVVGFRYKPLT